MNKFSINSYMSLMNTDGSFWVIGDEKLYQMFNWIINIGMVLNRWIYQVVDLSLQIFMNNKVFEETIGMVFKVAVSLYSSLFSSIGVTLFLIALGSITVIFFVSSPQEAFRKIIVLFAVIGINSVIYVQGEEYLKDVNNIFNEVENVMSSAIALPMFDIEGNKSEIQVGSESSVETIREVYFQLSMKQAFSMVNFGTPVYEKDFDDFLYTVEQETDKKAMDELKSKVKTASEKNRYLTPDGAIDKIFISVYSVCSNLFVGAPLMLMGIMKFLLKILIMVMVFGFPILSILSLIPKFSNSIFNGMGKMMMIFFIGIFLTVAMYLFFFVMTLIDSSVIALAGVAGGATIISCVLSAIVKGFAIYMIWKFRNQIVSFVTGGHVTNVNNFDRRMLNAMKKSGREGSASGEVAGNLSINHADIEIGNANVYGNLSENEGSNNDDIDSRDYANIDVENAEIEADNLNDDEYSKTNENRADTEKAEIDPEFDPEQEETTDLNRVEIENDNEMESIDPVEVLPADTEKIEIEDQEPLEVEQASVESLDSTEPPKNESGDPDSYEMNQVINSNTVNDIDSYEEPPENNYEQFYQKLEMLRNE
ncbi:hypothetical protein ACYSNR_14915 [Enterococcus sp. LJL128]